MDLTKNSLTLHEEQDRQQQQFVTRKTQAANSSYPASPKKVSPREQSIWARRAGCLSCVSRLDLDTL